MKSQDLKTELEHSLYKANREALKENEILKSELNQVAKRSRQLMNEVTPQMGSLSGVDFQNLNELGMKINEVKDKL